MNKFLRTIGVAASVFLFATGIAAAKPSGTEVYSSMMNAMMALPKPPTYIKYNLVFTIDGFWMQFDCKHHALTRFMPAFLKWQGVRMSFPVLVRTEDGMARVGSPTLESAAGEKNQPRLGPLFCRPFPFSPLWTEARDIGNGSLVRAAATHERTGSTAADVPPNPLDTIVTVVAYANRFYRIQNLGIEKRFGSSVYHLVFTAKGNPRTYPITDVYVTVRHHFLKAVAFGGGQRGLLYGAGVSAILQYGSVDGYWLLQRGHFELDAHVLVAHKAGSFDLRLEHFSFPSTGF